MLENILTYLLEKLSNRESTRNFGAKRSYGWRGVRRRFIRHNPYCAVCKTKKNLQVHHVSPFHIDPNLELELKNLITLCHTHHFWFGHFGSYFSYNPNVKEDANDWFHKILNRP